MPRGALNDKGIDRNQLIAAVKPDGDKFVARSAVELNHESLGTEREIAVRTDEANVVTHTHADRSSHMRKPQRLATTS